MSYRKSQLTGDASEMTRGVHPGTPAERSIGVGCGALVVALVTCADASAANWELAPRVQGGYRYNDNYRLDQPGFEIDVSGVEADAQVEIRTLDPRTNFSITPRIRSTYFPDERDEDSNDYFLSMAFNDTTPRRRTSVPLSWSREDVVRSELPMADDGADLGEVDATDTGSVVQRNRRDLLRFTPSFSYDVSQRLRADFDAHYVDADYERTFQNEQNDFREYGVSAGVGFLGSERSTISVRALAAKYETASDADSFGGEVEWSRDFTEASRFYVRVGAQQTEPEDRDSTTNWIGGIGSRWTSPRNELLVDLTHSVNASASGDVIERQQLRFRVDHDVSPRVAVLLALRGHRDDPIDGDGPTREYAAAQTGIEWRWNRVLSLSATYDYRWQDYEDRPSDASSNGFLISLVYEPKRSE